MNQNADRKPECKMTSIGGQALIEGVMMKGPHRVAMAVRTPSGELDIESWDYPAATQWYKKTPFIRGIFNFIDMMKLGSKCLMKSAEKAGFADEEPEKESRFDRWLNEKLGENGSKVIMTISMVLGIAFALLIFTVLPSFIGGLVGKHFESDMVRTVLEAVIKAVLFIGYLVLVTCNKDMRRVFEYHGAEHKTIACYEAEDELIPSRVKNYCRFHPRCGTSFLLIVLVVSIIVFSFLPWASVGLRVLYKILLLPVVVGISYEIIRVAGRSRCLLARIVSAPGLWLQRLTTKEPDESQIEAAIASMKAVIPENGEDILR